MKIIKIEKGNIFCKLESTRQDVEFVIIKNNWVLKIRDEDLRKVPVRIAGEELSDILDFITTLNNEYVKELLKIAIKIEKT